MAIKASPPAAAAHYLVERQTVCLFWRQAGEVTDFYMTSSKKSSCPTKGNLPKGKKSTQTSGVKDNFNFICWEKVIIHKKTKKWKDAGCAASCYCPPQQRGSAPTIGTRGDGFEEKMGITRTDDGKITIKSKGERIIEDLIDNDDKVPNSWEVRRWEHCVGTDCPGVEGVTK